MRIRSTSRDRVNTVCCLENNSLCAAAVERPGGLFALLSYETAGIAAFSCLYTEDTQGNHPKIEEDCEGTHFRPEDNGAAGSMFPETFHRIAGGR